MITNNPYDQTLKLKLREFRGGIPYQYLLRSVYPKLRVAICKVNYEVKNFKVDEAREVFKKRPQNLSLDEMFLVANSYPENSLEFLEVFETAARMYPEDEVAGINAAVASLSRNDLVSAERYLKRVNLKRNQPVYDNAPGLAIVKAAKAKADEIKGSAYALGKAPEHLSEKQQLRVNLIASQNPRLYRAYLLKEQLRLLLKLTNVDEAEDELKRWLWKASHSRIPAFKELYQKIRRHKTHILNTIRYGMSNARIEATNNKIKLIIRKAYGFRNIQNMLDMVYLVCSDIRIPLPNRKLNAA